MRVLCNIAFCSEKDVWSESGEKYAQIKDCLLAKKSKTLLNKYGYMVHFNLRGQQGIDFFTGGSNIIDYGLYFSQKQQFKDFFIL